MAFRNLYIQNPARLSIAKSQLVIQQEERYTVPVEDISSIMIEHKQCTITAPALSFLAEHQVAVFTCDQKHLPCAVVLPLGQYYRKLEALESQLHVRTKTKARLWQKLMKQKIENQAKVLELNHCKNIAELNFLATQVTEGDKTFKESRAARLYFMGLFGDKFNRRNEDVMNGALNYGYAIIRGIIARDICAYGFEPAFGVFHKNELNPFNLADDLIEPFRAYVDLWVYEHQVDLKDGLTPKNKQALFQLLFTEVRIDNEFHSLSNAVHKSVSSYTTCCRNNSAAGLKLPELIPLVAHEYE
ncbi:type II CRISPR-associated endonuclease Cas1 [Loigolactobacillus zhaoyuanensis]|uniref:type II CRISPR-associated endonuclease Cas1 n=1 Tax=Loigolactobacillus zhaoyuanensis TaxID=2486017 RepID=UPI000F738DE1|nr:type II CRISPR-associated endonuclease Cas1 [Loigolactobacillus zhaoyuanensis]